MARIIRAALGRMALLVLGLILGVVALEGALQLAAVVVRATVERPPEVFATPARRVLAVGDSNTYGLWMPRGAAYPAMLERRWNERHGERRLEVLNLGYPGSNSSRVRRDMPRMLETIRPDVVLIMIGANDFWTVPVAGDAPAAPQRQPLWQRSRIYRLLLMLWRAREPAEGQVTLETRGHTGTARLGAPEFELGFAKAEPGANQKWRQWLRDNLVAIVGVVRSAGAVPVLLTYPAFDPKLHPWYAGAGSVITTVARETGTPLVELGAEFKRSCTDPACLALLLPDGHPNGSGYAYVADVLIEKLPDLLGGP